MGMDGNSWNREYQGHDLKAIPTPSGLVPMFVMAFYPLDSKFIVLVLLFGGIWRAEVPILRLPSLLIFLDCSLLSRLLVSLYLL